MAGRRLLPSGALRLSQSILRKVMSAMSGYTQNHRISGWKRPQDHDFDKTFFIDTVFMGVLTKAPLLRRIMKTMNVSNQLCSTIL